MAGALGIRPTGMGARSPISHASLRIPRSRGDSVSGKTLSKLCKRATLISVQSNLLMVDVGSINRLDHRPTGGTT